MSKKDEDSDEWGSCFGGEEENLGSEAGKGSKQRSPIPKSPTAVSKKSKSNQKNDVPKEKEKDDSSAKGSFQSNGSSLNPRPNLNKVFEESKQAPVPQSIEMKKQESNSRFQNDLSNREAFSEIEEDSEEGKIVSDDYFGEDNEDYVNTTVESPYELPDTHFRKLGVKKVKQPVAKVNAAAVHSEEISLPFRDQDGDDKDEIQDEEEEPESGREEEKPRAREKEKIQEEDDEDESFLKMFQKTMKKRDDTGFQADLTTAEHKEKPKRKVIDYQARYNEKMKNIQEKQNSNVMNRKIDDAEAFGIDTELLGGIEKKERKLGKNGAPEKPRLPPTVNDLKRQAELDAFRVRMMLNKLGSSKGESSARNKQGRRVLQSRATKQRNRAD